MKWAEILKKSFEYLKKYRYLWFLGALAALTEGSFGGSYFGGSGGRGWSGGKEDFGNITGAVSNWVSSHLVFISVSLIILFFLSIVILYISYCAQAALIHSIDKIESGKSEENFFTAFRIGWRYFWRFFGLTLAITLIIAVAVLVFVGVILGFVVLAATTSWWALLVLIPFGVVGLLAIIALVIYLNLIIRLAYRGLVLKNQAVFESLAKSRKLFHHNFGDILIAWLIQSACGIVFGIAIVIIAVFVGGPLIMLGIGIFFATGPIGAWIYGSVAGIAFLLAILFINGLANAYLSTFWTLVYKTLNSKS